MSDLLDKLQSATEGSRELDVRIHLLVMDNPDEIVVNGKTSRDCVAWSEERGDWNGTARVMSALHYTTNLQDTVSLVPEGCQYAVGNMYQPDGHFYAEISSEDTGQGLGKASTGPLALCIAIIKAHEAER